jgi:phage baseplate assembly protein W
VTPDPKKAFLGVGWAFPLRASAGRTATAAYDEDIREAIRIIIGTNPGERVMRPDFGAGLNQFLFEPVNTTTLATLQQRVQAALVDWEPRIDVNTVTVTAQWPSDATVPDPNDRDVLFIQVAYTVRATNSNQNLVYPFYLGEGSAS